MCYKEYKIPFFRIRNIVVYSVVGILMFIAMALQTGFRSTGTYSLTGDDFTESIISMGETFGVYSVIPIRLFDYALNNYYFDKFGGAKYGRASVAGFDGIATGVIRRFSGIEIESTLEIVDYLQDNEIYIIPGNHPYNYCYTALIFLLYGFRSIWSDHNPVLFLGCCLDIIFSSCISTRPYQHLFWFVSAIS